ncbi:unnamed protein product [Schistocephalus solidus]|uniref:Uncharacterized protein n=1 Tax=Schistocephalus solidus TaxID=70667 RepID=A0A3P7D9R6_SCHSO|nr:unnamed protein product [Schistocephalus solidus]
MALFGILLKTSAPFVRSILDKAFSLGAKISDKEAEEITTFILNNSTGVSVILILVGLSLAILCFFGAFASCCGCGILLKIYGCILLVLLIVQIIAAAVIYSDPSKAALVVVVGLAIFL